MATYDDDAISLDDSGITIKHYHLPGRTRHIPYNDIMRAELVALRFCTGRRRLVGFSPGRPRHFFHWDRERSAKTHGVSLDVGR